MQDMRTELLIKVYEGELDNEDLIRLLLESIPDNILEEIIKCYRLLD